MQEGETRKDTGYRNMTVGLFSLGKDTSTWLSCMCDFFKCLRMLHKFGYRSNPNEVKARQIDFGRQAMLKGQPRNRCRVSSREKEKKGGY